MYKKLITKGVKNDGYELFIPAIKVTCRGVVNNVGASISDIELITFSGVSSVNIKVLEVRRFKRKSKYGSGSIMFHVRRRPADCAPRKRKKKPGALGQATSTRDVRGDTAPLLVELGPDGSAPHPGDTARTIRLTNDVMEELQKYNVSYLLTSFLNQDPLENFFAIVRNRGGYNSTPSVSQLRIAIKHNTNIKLKICLDNGNYAIAQTDNLNLTHEVTSVKISDESIETQTVHVEKYLDK
ncbi:unnamed protein product [Diabrotica balteata]|uniref:Transposable element P transposase-like RNase H C-terminal domain-containing protein n=1 Tax=Diabrotica balteata TaxID=107213 RepID=A0A9N9TAJ2_DIABA|nr:unnamed protein product [Diabrotica balteata]